MMTVTTQIRKVRARNYGFTLIELVIVMVILGIIAAILTPIALKFIEEASKSADSANARLLYHATSAYYSKILVADADVNLDDISFYIGIYWPQVRSKTFAGTFACSVTAAGQVIVTTGTSNYAPSAGSLVIN